MGDGHTVSEQIQFAPQEKICKRDRNTFSVFHPGFQCFNESPDVWLQSLAILKIIAGGLATKCAYVDSKTIELRHVKTRKAVRYYFYRTAFRVYLCKL
jgi:hypothetical protein